MTTTTTSYAVTVNDHDGRATTFRYVSHAKMLDGLVSFGGIHLYGTGRTPILAWEEEAYTPTHENITCHGRFGCE